VCASVAASTPLASSVVLLVDGFRIVAPKTLVKQLEDSDQDR
jgi:hypothetical protein